MGKSDGAPLGSSEVLGESLVGIALSLGNLSGAAGHCSVFVVLITCVPP